MTRSRSAGGASRVAVISAVNTLADPARRALYEFVSRSTEPVSRDTAAEAIRLPRSTAAFHLDRLAAEGLLEVEFRRLSGKTGPGSGRPAKLYRRASTEIGVTLPARDYELAGDIMASAIERSIETGSAVQETLRDVAGERGRGVGASAGTLPAALEGSGFEPRADGESVVLGNCPFHRLADRHTDIVCELNYEFVCGIAEGARDTGSRVSSEPGAGRCCIRITQQRHPPPHQCPPRTLS